MGSVTITFCCACGVRTSNLTTYIQYTDFERRSTDAYNQNNKVELCDECLKRVTKEFQNIRKFKQPKDIVEGLNVS